MLIFIPLESFKYFHGIFLRISIGPPLVDIHKQMILMLVFTLEPLRLLLACVRLL